MYVVADCDLTFEFENEYHSVCTSTIIILFHLM